MLVLRGERCLLGRQASWPSPFFSALAGFVEGGETLEEAVRREVYSKRPASGSGAVRYLASQPWPFPASLMMGCLAEGLTEEIQVDGTEIAEARWFTRERGEGTRSQASRKDPRRAPRRWRSRTSSCGRGSRTARPSDRRRHAWDQLGLPTWAFEKGLVDIGNGHFAYLQPDGSWGWSNAGLVVDGDQSLLVDTLFDVPLTQTMLDTMRDATPAAAHIDRVVNTHANGDHCHGNELVADAEIISSKATAEEMEELPPAVLAGIVAATKDDDTPFRALRPRRRSGPSSSRASSTRRPPGPSRRS